jgi:iron(III) transport system substrate-binding protein
MMRTTWKVGAVGVLGAWVGLAVACAPSAPVDVGPREQERILQQVPETLTPEQRKYRDALKEFSDTVVPAAKKEGQINWYSNLDAQDTDRWIKTFNKYYPDIQVNAIYGDGFNLVEKIAAESAAGRVQADTYVSGINTARDLGRRGLGVAANPPSALNPDVKWNFPISEGDGVRIFWATNGIGGFVVNTKFIPPERYPKTWWDVVRDPYWADMTKRGLVMITDPRRTGMSQQVLYGLRVLKKDEYGENYFRELAAMKLKYAPSGGGDVLENGEVYAHWGGSISPSSFLGKAPLKLLCPAPGCVQSYLAPVMIKNAPHPNAARVWTEFWLTREGQEFIASLGYTVNRSDVPVPPETDWKNFPQMFISTEDHDPGLAAGRKYNADSKLWDY